MTITTKKVVVSLDLQFPLHLDIKMETKEMMKEVRKYLKDAEHPFKIYLAIHGLPFNTGIQTFTSGGPDTAVEAALTSIEGFIDLAKEGFELAERDGFI